MSELSEKIVEVKGTESHEELVMVARENFDMIQRLLERLQTTSSAAIATSTDHDPTYANVTATREKDKVYRNGGTTMKVVQISVTLSA